MTHIGDFGTEHDPVTEPHTFGYFGSVYRVRLGLSDIDMIDIVETTFHAQALSGVQQLIAMKDLLRSLIHADDFEAVWAAAKANRQDADDIANLTEALMESVSDRPTQQPSGSSPGRPSTEPSSVDDSSSVVRSLEQRGRPDLALVVARAGEARSA